MALLPNRRNAEKYTMGLIDDMWQVHLACIPRYEGKLFIPLTGGLDSRILVGIIRHLKMDVELFGYYYYQKCDIHNLEHITKITNIYNYAGFDFYLNPLDDYMAFNHHKAYTEMNQKYNFKDFTLIIHRDGLEINGGLWPGKRRRDYWYVRAVNPREKYDESQWFKEVSYPFFNALWVGFMDSLPKHLKFKQHGFIQMIRKYLPEVYDIPRCYDKGNPPIPLKHFTTRKTLRDTKDLFRL